MIIFPHNVYKISLFLTRFHFSNQQLTTKSYYFLQKLLSRITETMKLTTLTTLLLPILLSRTTATQLIDPFQEESLPQAAAPSSTQSDRIHLEGLVQRGFTKDQSSRLQSRDVCYSPGHVGYSEYFLHNAGCFYSQNIESRMFQFHKTFFFKFLMKNTDSSFFVVHKQLWASIHRLHETSRPVGPVLQ